MLLDQNRAFEGAAGGTTSLAVLVVLIGIAIDLLLLDADEHLAKEEALELLPRLAVFAHTQHPVQTELAKPISR